MEDKVFSLRLAKLRAKKGVSARDMSLSIGQNPGYIHNIEAGKCRPSMAGFYYICEYLDVTPSEFFDIESNYPTKLNGIIENLKKLNDQQLDTIALLVNDLVKK